MRTLVLATIVSATGIAFAQSASPLPGPCTGLSKHHRALNSGHADTSLSTLTNLETRSADCLTALFAQLAPEQRAAAQAALQLYQAANSRLVQQVRERDIAETRTSMEQAMKDGGAEMASLFARLSELSYRYDQLLDQVGQYMVAEESFHKAVAQSPGASASPPARIVLPDKVEFLHCSDYHVGRFSSCWPPDYDD